MPPGFPFTTPGAPVFGTGTVRVAGDDASLVRRYPNELGITNDYAIATLGGTVTESTAHVYAGTQSLRINRTGTTRIDATANSPWGTARVISGFFWLWADALPSANIAIFQLPNNSGDNVEIRLDATGNLSLGRQNSTNSLASQTLLTTGRWYRISWWWDQSTTAWNGWVAVNDDPPVNFSWTMSTGGETPVEWVFGSRLVTTVSTYDLYYDEGEAYVGWFLRPAPAAPVNPVFSLANVTSAGSSNATGNNVKIQLPSRTSAGTAGSTGGAIALVQEASKINGATSVTHTVTLPGAITTGNCLVVVVHESAGTGSGALISSIGLDAGAASFVLPAAVVQTTAPPSDAQASVNSMVSIAYALNVTGGGTVVTVTLALSKIASVKVYELSSVAISGAVDQSNGGGGGTIGTAMVAPAINVAAGAIAIEAITDVSGTLSTNAAGSTPTTGWTFSSQPASATVTGASAYQIFPAGQSGAQAAWTNSTAQKWGAVSISFLSGGGGPGTRAANLTLPSLLNVTSAGVSTAVASALQIRLPARTSVGVGTATATGLKELLPAVAVAGSSGAVATGLRIRLPNRTSVGAATASAPAVGIRLPSRTSAGTATATATALRTRLPSITSAGVGTASANNIRIRLPSRTSAGSATATANLTARFPSRTSAGTSTATATALKIRLPNRTSAGVGTTAQTGLKVRLPNRTSAGIATPAAVEFRVLLPARTTAGVATPAQTGLRIKLPNRASAGSSTSTAVDLTTAGGFFTFPARTSAGNSSASAPAPRIRLPNRSSAGVGTTLASSLRARLPNRTSAGSSTATATNLRIRLPNQTVAGSATASANQIKIRLPNRTTAGLSIATFTALKIRLPSRTAAGTSSISQAGLKDRIALATSAGSSNATAQAFRIKLPARTSSGQATTIVPFLIGAMVAVASHGTSTTSTTGLKIRLPNRTSAGTSTAVSGGLKDRIAIVTSAGVGTATAQGLRIQLPPGTIGPYGPDFLVGPDTMVLPGFASSATVTGLQIRLPGRTTQGTSSSTAGPLRIALRVMSIGSSSALAQAFQIRLPLATSTGTAAVTARAFLYIPPPPKIVQAASTIHSLVASSTTHVAASSSSSVPVTASTSRAVTTAGDLTKTVTIRP